MDRPFCATLSIAGILTAVASAASPPAKVTRYAVTDWKTGCSELTSKADAAKEIRVEVGEASMGRFINVFTPAPKDARNIMAAFGWGEADGDGPYSTTTSSTASHDGHCELESTTVTLTISGGVLTFEERTLGLKVKQPSCTTDDVEKNAAKLTCTSRVVVAAKKR